MEFVIGREEFHWALERVQGIVDKRNTIPLLANVLIQTIPGGIKITASDMEIAFTGEYEANVMSQGEITLGAKQLFDIVRNLPQATVRLRRLDNDWMEITSGKAYFKIVGLSSEGYPAIPSLDGATTLQLSSPALKEMIDHTFFSIATDDSRYGLNGAFLERLEDSDGGSIRMISTDGHRLSLIDRPLKGDVDLGDGYLLPRKGLAELKKLCDEFGENDVEVAFSDNSAIFRHGRIVFFMRLLEGDFPDYRQVIPQRSLRKVTIVRDELSRALKRVSILSSEKTHSVRFRISGEGLEISASNPDLGESRETVDAQVEGEPLAIGFNARYFLDALAVLKGEHVMLELGDSLNPGIIKEKDRDDVMFVVMPMRLE
jgi:DNA polymerase-3 subunit beta